MKKILITSMTLTAILYTCTFISISFVTWEISNPFQWIILIPTYSPETRFFILFAIACYYIFNLNISIGIHKKKDSE